MKFIPGFFALLCSLCGLLTGSELHAQLCAGSLGDPVVHITFGAGQNPGPQLDNNNYNFWSQDCPNDGQYTVRNRTDGCFGNTWHRLTSDHTGDPNGYFMLVNASFQPGDFYRSTVKGLCGNTTYEFAAWVVNMMNTAMCGGGTTIKSNLSFSIETTGGTVLATYNTGDIDITSQPEWKQYGMFFTTPANATEVVVRLRNNAPGGCGNDLALDDITFRPCGASINAAIEGVTADSVALCAGDPTTYRLKAVVNSAYQDPEVQWQESTDRGGSWQPIAGATTASYDWTGRPAGHYQYRLVVAERGNINSTACRVASKPVTVRVQALPVVDAGAFMRICQGANGLLDARIHYPDSTRGSYQWQLPTGVALNFTPTDSGAVRSLRGSFTAGAASAGLYQLTATSTGGCLARDTFSLALLAKPAAALVLPNLSCADDMITYRSASQLAGGTISTRWWQLTGPEDSATGSDSVFAYRFSGTGIRTLRFVAEGNNGCRSDTIVTEVTIKPKPFPDFRMPEVCLSDPAAQFQNSSSIEGGEALTYRWTFGDPANPGVTSTLRDPSYRYNRQGVFQVRLRATSASGCVADTVRAFTVNGAAPKASFVLGNPTLLCSADSVVLRNTATVDFGSITRLEIRWNNSDPATLTTDEDPIAGKTYAFRYQPLMNNAAQSFTIRMRAFSGVGCVDETVQTVTINRSPEVTLATLPIVCANDPAFALVQGAELSGATGRGSYSGPGVGATGIFDPVAAGAGIHAIRYRFTSANGCIADTVQNIRVGAIPQVSAGPDQTVIIGGTITLQGSASGNGLQYAWSPATGLSATNVLQPSAKPEADQLYQLTATSADGCVAFDTVRVSVINDLFIPTAFTPDGDGLNDTWQVPYLESARDVRVQVFNRYGQVVFESRGGNRWNGRFKGADLPNGAYVYLVRYNGRTQKGVVMLIR